MALGCVHKVRKLGFIIFLTLITCLSQQLRHSHLLEVAQSSELLSHGKGLPWCTSLGCQPQVTRDAAPAQ